MILRVASGAVFRCSTADVVIGTDWRRISDIDDDDDDDRVRVPLNVDIYEKKRALLSLSRQHTADIHPS